jgi:hypothetical protein
MFHCCPYNCLLFCVFRLLSSLTASHDWVITRKASHTLNTRRSLKKKHDNSTKIYSFYNCFCLLEKPGLRSAFGAFLTDDFVLALVQACVSSCMCACVSACCVRKCVRKSVSECVRKWVRACVSACVFVIPTVSDSALDDDILFFYAVFPK